MRFSILALSLAAIAGAQAQSTVLAPCGTACPSAVPDVTVTRSNPPVAESTPCPSLIVSSMKGNSSNPTATGAPGSPAPAPFTGAANQLAGSAGVVMAAVAAALVL
ncbi:MAG: hypothetical protein L6R42_003341 [Xanthoria sp. 1 TBL-2021]|nr:MAG: hypothetical protein L6R42_003341 [Xanthoria sp. 1 TBL-2021]